MQKVLFLFILVVFIIPAYSQEEERIKGWRSDLDLLTQKMEAEHYNLFHTISRKEWERSVSQLNQSIPQLSDLEITGEMMKLMAMIGDGHTVMYPPFQGKNAFMTLPVEFYIFEEGVYIRAADPAYSEYVGNKVLKVGEMDIKDVLLKLQEMISRDNDYQVKWISPIGLIFSDLYFMIGATNSRSEVTFLLEKQNGERTSVTVTAEPLSRDPMSRFAPGHWTDMADRSKNLWTRDPDNFYWYEYLAERNIVYCQFNQVRNKDGESIADFSRRLHNFVREKESDALILDIRLNNGGNSFLNRAFIHEIIKNEGINREGKLFTIIGRRTFSAAMNLSSDLEFHTETLFVGEPTGSRPNFIGEDNEFVLPYSGLAGSISTRYWQGGSTSDDKRDWIAPHIKALLTAEDYRNNVDPCLNAIYNYLDNKE